MCLRAPFGREARLERAKAMTARNRNHALYLISLQTKCRTRFFACKERVSYAPPEPLKEVQFGSYPDSRDLMRNEQTSGPLRERVSEFLELAARLRASLFMDNPFLRPPVRRTDADGTDNALHERYFSFRMETNRKRTSL